MALVKPYYMDLTDKAVFKPIESPDLVSGIDPSMLQNILLSAILDCRDASKARHDIVQGFCDGLFSNVGIDSGLSSGYLYNSTPDTITAASGTEGDASAGNAYHGDSFTLIHKLALTNNRYITAVNLYQAISTGSGYKLKLCKVSGSDYIITDLDSGASFTKPSTGLVTWTLATPYLIPNDGGTYYIGFYLGASNASDNSANSTGGSGVDYKAGDLSGTVGGFDTAAGMRSAVSVVLRDYATPIIITTASTAIDAATSACALVFVENYHSSLTAYVSTATTPSWAELTNLVNIGTPISGVSAYFSDVVEITGSANKSHRLKLTWNPGNATACSGHGLYWTI